MPKFLKTGKVVIVTQGRRAGRKAVVVRMYESGTNSRKFGHALVCGVKKYPLAVTKGMSKHKIAMRSKVRPFVKLVNVAHLMPTRYNVEMEGKSGNLRQIASLKNLEPARRKKTKILLQKALTARYLAGKNRWFFSKLRF